MQLTGTPLEPLRSGIVVLTIVACLAVIAGLRDRDPGEMGPVRSRLLHGVPWGTLLTVVCVAGVYLFVQGGLSQPRDPLVLPFRSWSYFYPLGMLTAAFTHSSLGHVTSNLLATLAFASVAEYSWGHYPRERGSQTFSSVRTNPYARILAVVAASFVVGVFTAVFAIGPVVGFSGVVFAYAGFAIVRRPVLGVLALVGARVLSQVFSALQNPVSVAVARPRVVTPWWTNIAIQGHAIGVLAGVLLAVVLAWRRDDWPSPWRLWFAALAFAVVEGLWAIYAPTGPGRFVLFRWAGTAAVFILATLVAMAGARSDVTLVPRSPVSRRPAASTALVAVLVLISVPAVVLNVAAIDQQPTPQPSVEVQDYSVAYAEDVENGYAAAIQIPFANESESLNASGVIVTSERRYVWIQQIQPARLAQRGEDSVVLGGLGWREEVHANRTGWRVSGNQSVYKVYLRPEDDERTLAYQSDPSRASPTIAGRNITLRPTTDTFEFAVSRNGSTVGAAAMPANGSTASAGGVTFRRNGSHVYAVRNQTRVPVAERENE